MFGQSGALCGCGKIRRLGLAEAWRTSRLVKQCVLSYDIIAECIVSLIVIKHLQLVFVWKMCVDSELAMLS